MVMQALALRMPTTGKAFGFSLSRISYYDGLHFANAKHCGQPLPPNCWLLGFKSAGVAKDRSPAANIDADRALISFKEMPIRQVEANHDALNVARGEIGGLAVERATLINDFEGRQNPVLLDIVEFDGFHLGTGSQSPSLTWKISFPGVGSPLRECIEQFYEA
jgi:hypothetical protein